MFDFFEIFKESNLSYKNIDYDYIIEISDNMLEEDLRLKEDYMFLKDIEIIENR